MFSPLLSHSVRLCPISPIPSTMKPTIFPNVRSPDTMSSKYLVVVDCVSSSFWSRQNSSNHLNRTSGPTHLPPTPTTLPNTCTYRWPQRSAVEYPQLRAQSTRVPEFQRRPGKYRTVEQVDVVADGLAAHEARNGWRPILVSKLTIW